MPNTKALIGHPSVDKPQMKYYRETPVRQIKTDQTIYELVFASNKDNLSLPAIRYMKKEWTFGGLKEKVDAAAKAFSASGLKLGDVVLIGLPNIPEAVVCLLALNKIGVVSKWFDIRAGERDIEEYLTVSNCRFAIILDMLLPLLESISRKMELRKVLVVSPVDSLSKAIQTGYKLKNKQKFISDEKFQPFNSFLKQYKNCEDPKTVSFDADRPAIMIQSSGTTGKPKSIVHSDYSATSSVFKHTYYDLPVGMGKVVLDTLPPWIAYAIGGAILYPLALGAKVILHPTVENEAITKYFGEFTVSMAAPFHYRYLYDHFNEIDIRRRTSFLETVECLISGGDKLTIEENKAFDELFHAPLVNGWGNNEGWGCLSVNPAKHNHYGSVGIPKYEETIIAYDNDRQEELPYNQVGEICVLTDTLFQKYENNEEETLKAKRTHSDGKVWLHTGDLGYIDENGFLFLSGRIRRVIIRQGFKISAYTIEDAISEHPAVKECVAVEVIDAEEEHVPMAFVTLKDSTANIEAIKNELIEKCKRDLKGHEIPKHFRFLDKLPYTQNGKYDFRMLETMGNEWVREQGFGT